MNNNDINKYIDKNIDNTDKLDDIINHNKEKKILDNSDVSVVYDSPKKEDNEDNKLNNNENINKGFNLKIKNADGEEEDWNIQT